MSTTVKVGDSVKLGGKSFICMSIDTRSIDELAKHDSATMRANLVNYTNTRHILVEVEDFKEYEPIHVEQQVVELVDPGKDVQYIYTYTKVTKIIKEIENVDVAEGTERETKNDREGSVREGSEGSETASEGGGTMDGGR